MATFALDIDDVCLNWRGNFFAWMAQRGLLPLVPARVSALYDFSDAWPDRTFSMVMDDITQFNMSPEFAKLEPLPGALDSIATLQTAGHRLVAVTAPGIHPSVVATRTRQIHALGIDAFQILPLGTDKAHVLRSLGASVLVDDHPQAPVYAVKAQIPVLLYDQPYNRTSVIEHGRRVHGWAEALPALLAL